MAIRFFTGFDQFATIAAVNRLLPGSTVDGGVTFPAGRITTKSIDAGTGLSTLHLPAQTAQTTWLFSAGLRARDPVSGTILFALHEAGGTEQIRLEVVSVTATGYKLAAKRGSTTIATSAIELLNSQWYHVEWKTLLATGSTGTTELRVNTSSGSGFSASSVQTANGGTNLAANARVNLHRQATGGSEMRIDDLLLLDGTGTEKNDFLGDIIIEESLANDDGDSSQFTPSAGANYQTVDDPLEPDDDATYVQSSTIGNEDLYKYGPLAFAATAPLAVQVTTDWRLLAAGSRNVATLHKHTNGTKTIGPSVAVASTAYAPVFQIWEQNPATSAAWQLADFNSGTKPQFGIRAAS